MKQLDLWGTCCVACGNVRNQGGVCPAGCDHLAECGQLEQPVAASKMEHLVGNDAIDRRHRLSFRVSHHIYGRMPGIALRWLAAPEGHEL